MWLNGRAWWWYQAGVFVAVQLLGGSVAAMSHGRLNSLTATVLTYCAVVAVCEAGLLIRRGVVILAASRGSESSAALFRDT